MTSQKTPDVGVTYINKRPEWTDNIYGSGLTFETGQTRVVPDELARSFLRHEDIFERAKDTKATEKAIKADKLDEAKEVIADVKDDTKEQLAAGKAKKEAERKQEHEVMDIKDTVARMDKSELTNYAKVHFKQDLNQKAGVKDLRNEVVQFIDRFGVA